MSLSNPYRVHRERREQLESCYRDGLIAEYTQVPRDDQADTRWMVDTYTDSAPTVLTSRHVPAFVDALRAGATAGGLVRRRPRPGDAMPVPYAALPAIYGVSTLTFRVWVSRAQFPPSIIIGAIRYESGRVSYRNAYVTRRDALHWGKSTGRLHHDGTPNVKTANPNVVRDLAQV